MQEEDSEGVYSSQEEDVDDDEDDEEDEYEMLNNNDVTGNNISYVGNSHNNNDKKIHPGAMLLQETVTNPGRLRDLSIDHSHLLDDASRTRVMSKTPSRMVRGR